MARVLLVRPWRFQDQGVAVQDLSQQWRNAPYSLVLLATLLRSKGHDARILDMERNLIHARGDLDVCLALLHTEIAAYKPEIVGVGFFSVHFLEVVQLTAALRKAASTVGYAPLLVAGGIHATVAPASVLAPPPEGPGFDCLVMGEAENALLQLADGAAPASVPGVMTSPEYPPAAAQIIEDLDTLPFPDWELIDHALYATPTWARTKFELTSSLDLLMGRGCPYSCGFCAYGALSKVRTHSAAYMADAVEHTLHHAPGVYFLDSSIGSWRKELAPFCEELIRRGLHKRVRWYANMRSDQVDRELLQLLYRAGCRYLFYGFESGDQEVLDAMHKRNTVDNNRKTALLHNELTFPYHASILVNHPADSLAALRKTIAFLDTIEPPSSGVNWYVPLPGSADFAALRAQGLIAEQDPATWRMVGEVNAGRFWPKADEDAYRAQVAELERLAYTILPARVAARWSAQ